MYEIFSSYSVFPDLIGHETTEQVKIFNNESIALHFAIDEGTLNLPGHGARLHIEPMSGWLQPNSSLPINVTFCPRSDKEVNFNVNCVIKKKALPLTLNIKAEGYSMECVVMCEDSASCKVELYSNSINNINFGEVSTCIEHTLEPSPFE